MKIIFLDIDGVLATHKEFMMNRTKFQSKHPEAKELNIPYPFNSGCVKVFNEILKETDAKIVLSSDWRLYWSLEELDKIFKFNGVIKSPEEITGVSSGKMSWELEKNRVEEIFQFIEKNKIVDWVAVDDLNLSELGDRFINTRDNEGLKQLSLKDKILKVLNNESNSTQNI